MLKFTPNRSRMLVLEAAFWLVGARLLLLGVPFKYICRYLGRALPATSLEAPVRGPQDHLAVAVAGALRRAPGLLPFATVCLPRSLAALMMLRCRRVACQLHFGVVRSSESPEGSTLHAWLTAGAVEVTLAHAAVELGYFDLHGSGT